MIAVILLIALLASGLALAHDGHVHWFAFGATWTWDPWITVPLAASLVLYAVGVTRLWRRAGMGRGVRLWQAACFAGRGRVHGFAR